MKRLIRIAPFLIALSLGLEFFPGVHAVEITRQNFQEPTKKKIEAKFNGFIILPNYTEQLLFSESRTPSETYASEEVLYSKIDQPAKTTKHSYINCESETKKSDQIFSTHVTEKKCCSSQNSINN